MNHEAVVQHYRMNFQREAREQLDSFLRESTLGDAVEHAALAARPDGLRYSHQTRLKATHLAAAAVLLADHLGDIQDARNFAALHGLLKKLLASRAGLGELYLYDTALRIGAKLGLLPQAIYLHAGTRAGAKALKLSVTGNILLKSELPLPLQQLEPHELEDVLCIYKQYFAGKADLDDSRACWVDDEDAEE
jgi:hypothetical protein